MITVNTIMKDPTLSSTTKLVMVYLMETSKVLGSTEIIFKEEETASKIGRGSREVYRSLQELSEHGYIEFGDRKRKAPGRVVTINWVVDETLEEMLSYF